MEESTKTSRAGTRGVLLEDAIAKYESERDDKEAIIRLQNSLRLSPNECSDLLRSKLALPPQLWEFPNFPAASVMLPIIVGTGPMLGRWAHILVPNIDKRCKPNVYGMVVGYPGDGKTELMNKCLAKPYDAFDSELRAQYEAMAARDPEKCVMLTRTEYWALRRGRLSPPEMHEIKGRCSAMGQSFDGDPSMRKWVLANFVFNPKPSRLKDMEMCMAGDITAARFMSAAARNPILLKYDDVDTFKRIFGLGRKDGANFTDVLLSLHSDYKITVDRQGEDNDFVAADCMCSVWVNAQPERSGWMFASDGGGNGFMSRWVVMCNEPEPQDELSLGEFALARYPDLSFVSRYYGRLFNTFSRNVELGPDNRAEFRYSPEAERLQLEANRQLEFVTKLFTGRKMPKRAEMVSKMRECIDKFALIFQVMQDNMGDSIFDGISASDNRVVGRSCLEAGVAMSRLVFDQWIRLYAIAKQDDAEMGEFAADVKKSKYARRLYDMFGDGAHDAHEALARIAACDATKNFKSSMRVELERCKVVLERAEDGTTKIFKLR